MFSNGSIRKSNNTTLTRCSEPETVPRIQKHARPAPSIGNACNRPQWNAFKCRQCRPSFSNNISTQAHTLAHTHQNARSIVTNFMRNNFFFPSYDVFYIDHRVKRNRKVGIAKTKERKKNCVTYLSKLNSMC